MGVRFGSSHTIWEDGASSLQALEQVVIHAHDSGLDEVLREVAPQAHVVDVLEPVPAPPGSAALVEYRRRQGAALSTLELMATSVTESGFAVGAAVVVHNDVHAAVWVRQGHFPECVWLEHTARGGLHVVVDDPDSSLRPGPCVLRQLQGMRGPAIDYLPELLAGAALVVPHGYRRAIDATVLAVLTLGQGFTAATRHGHLLASMPQDEDGALRSLPLWVSLRHQVPPVVVAGDPSWAQRHAGELVEAALESEVLADG